MVCFSAHCFRERSPQHSAGGKTYTPLQAAQEINKQPAGTFVQVYVTVYTEMWSVFQFYGNLSSKVVVVSPKQLYSLASQKAGKSSESEAMKYLPSVLMLFLALLL